MRDLEQNTLTGAEETKLQYDYIEKAKSYIKEKEERLGRKLTCCVRQKMSMQILLSIIPVR